MDPQMIDHVVLFGDSVTVGKGFSGVDEDTNYVTVLGHLLRKAGTSTRLTASALDGLDSGYALRRFDRMVTRLTPNIVGISIGLNDAKPAGNRDKCDPDSFTQNLSHLVERCLEIDAHPVLSTPPPRTDSENTMGRGTTVMAPYAECVRHVANLYYLPLVDVYHAFASRHDLSSLLPDGLHPGPPGHQIIAQEYSKVLIPLLLRHSYPTPSDLRPIRSRTLEDVVS
jgi:lysophospholipase L1-like esterase